MEVLFQLKGTTIATAYKNRLQRTVMRKVQQGRPAAKRERQPPRKINSASRRRDQAMKVLPILSSRISGLALLSIFLLISSGCSPDVDYISSPQQFSAACSFCKPCKTEGQLGCAPPGETCRPLCTSEHSVARILDGYWTCRCSGTNDIWAYDPVKKTTILTQAPWSPPEEVDRSIEDLIQ